MRTLSEANARASDAPLPPLRIRGSFAGLQLCWSPNGFTEVQDLFAFGRINEALGYEEFSRDQIGRGIPSVALRLQNSPISRTLTGVLHLERFGSAEGRKRSATEGHEVQPGAKPRDSSLRSGSDGDHPAHGGNSGWLCRDRCRSEGA